VSFPHLEQCRVLIVEDEPDLAGLIALHLAAIPVETAHAGNGHEAVKQVNNGQWDLMILDIRLPGMDGLDVCKRVRETHPALPILMLTALGTETDRVLGLELGADDYLTKPFSVLELQARVKAQLRRSSVQASQGGESSGVEKLRSGRLSIDRSCHRAWVGSEEISLTRREFDLLWHFISSPGQVFSRSELLKDVWGYGHDGYDHTVNSHINRLRSKLRPLNNNADAIETVWGVGYRFLAMQ
jgi:DNA-binding response OmpR family regulator